MPSGHWARDEDLEPIAFDVAASMRLLDEAGYPDPDGDGPEARFRLTYKTSTNEESLLQAQIVQAMLGSRWYRHRASGPTSSPPSTATSSRATSSSTA